MRREVRRLRAAGCVRWRARAGEITAKNGLYYLACYRLITALLSLRALYTSFYSPRFPYVYIRAISYTSLLYPSIYTPAPYRTGFSLLDDLKPYPLSLPP